jgi:hypothetical protein
VRWNGVDLRYPECTPIQCRAQVRPSDIAQTGTVTVTIFTPSPGGGLSNGLAFTVYPNPVPAITSLDPPAVLSTTSSLILNVHGDGFVSGSKILWGGSQLGTTLYRSRTYLQGFVPSPALATPGTISVTVSSPPLGGGTSNTILFRIVDPATLTNKVYLPLVLK